MKPQRRPMRHEKRVTLLALAGGVPGVLVALAWVWGTPQPAHVRMTVSLLVIGAWIGFALAARERVIRPLQTLSNLMAALREGDYSIRARGADTNTPLGLAYHEVNTLAESLRRQRLDAARAGAPVRQGGGRKSVADFAVGPPA